MNRILFIGDIVGKGGRRAVNGLVPDLLKEFKCNLCIANGENMAGGAGITRKCISSVETSGVDVFTGGDHIWDQRSFPEEIVSLPQVLRPANFSNQQPGRGFCDVRLKNGGCIRVISLVGQVFINVGSNCPFETVAQIIKSRPSGCVGTVVDFHAEATSEKVAMGYFLDGKVSAVLGTHTHIPTADEQILPNGTAFQTDVGMVGARHSVLGRAVEPVLQRFTTGMPARFTVVEKGIRLNATLVVLNDDGKAVQIQRITRDWD